MEEMLDKLPDADRVEYRNMLNSPWYNNLKKRVQKAVLENPPFYLYRLKSAPGVLVTIKSYEESKKDREFPIFVCLKLKPEWNSAYAFEREIWGTPVEELIRVELVSEAKRKRRISTASGLPWMKRIINTRNREDVKRGNQQ